MSVTDKPTHTGHTEFIVPNIRLKGVSIKETAKSLIDLG